MTEVGAVDRVDSLSAFFRPSAVAVVGASPRASSGGHRIFRNLVRHFDGPVYPVHPSAEEILGRECYPSISAVPGNVDLVVVFVPSQLIPGIVEECIAVGVRAVCVEAGGFADAGEDGANLQQRLAQLAASSGIRIWGPNCAGFVTTNPYLSTAFVDAPESMPVGATSLIFQSGMAAAALLADITSRDLIAIDKACSIGNKVDVDEADLLAYLAREGTSNAIALYLESIADGKRLGAALDELVPEAMVCALMGNRTPAGLQAAATHTGAIVMQSDTVASYMKHRGVIDAADFTELVDLTRAYGVSGPRPGGSRVAILTFSGAAGVVAADLLGDQGLSLAPLSDHTLERLRAFFPDWYEPGNPVDLWSTVEQLGFADATGRTVEAVLEDEMVDALLFVPLAFNEYTSDDIKPFARAVERSDKPVVMWPIGDVSVVAGWEPLLAAAGVPVCTSLGNAVKVIEGFRIRTESLRRRAAGTAVEPKRVVLPWPELAGEGHRALNEVESKLIMSRFGVTGVREILVSGREEAIAAARQLGYPVVLKLVAEGLAHKTEVGGVVLDVTGGGRVGFEFDQLMAKAATEGLIEPRVLVQPMVEDGVEMIVGAKRDLALGWFVMLGPGGVDVESLGAMALRPAPLSVADVEEMIGELRGTVALEERRGSAGADVDALVTTVIAISDMVQQAPVAVEAIEVNPLIVLASGSGAVAVDALITLADPDTPDGRDDLDLVGRVGGERHE